ncbi:hypothetical protein BDZ45DRAFT_779741 [Acephala macrosclerotiorum]|nr:hypothetical protein BDZ45DRAFT_779741 [Acephala macrosclerotiorum]
MQNTDRIADSAVPNNFNVHSIEEPEADSLAGYKSEAYGNRIHCYLVVSPAGELLEALRDAIAGHRSLLENGKILYRDISENNIIITKPAAEGAPKRRLIDPDLAKELDSVPSGASHRSTMQFMATEVLQGKGHTYRIRVKPATSVLRDWYTGTYSQISRNKVGDMDKNEFENIVAEFGLKFESLKQLTRELRNILFPIMDGVIFTGTFRDNGIIYDGIIKAFNKAIGPLGK